MPDRASFPLPPRVPGRATPTFRSIRRDRHLLRPQKFRAAPCLILGGALALAACASEPDAPTFGERLSAEGSEVAELGAQWTQGDAMIAEGRALIDEGRNNVAAGNRLVERGEKRIRTGRREIDRGEELVARGNRLKREAEEAYSPRGETGTAGN